MASLHISMASVSVAMSSRVHYSWLFGMTVCCALIKWLGCLLYRPRASVSLQHLQPPPTSYIPFTSYSLIRSRPLRTHGHNRLPSIALLVRDDPGQCTMLLMVMSSRSGCIQIDTRSPTSYHDKFLASLKETLVRHTSRESSYLLTNAPWTQYPADTIWVSCQSKVSVFGRPLLWAICFFVSTCCVDCMPSAKLVSSSALLLRT